MKIRTNLCSWHFLMFCFIQWSYAMHFLSLTKSNEQRKLHKNTVQKTMKMTIEKEKQRLDKSAAIYVHSSLIILH